MADMTVSASAPPVGSLLETAFAAHQRGQFAEAERLYRLVLARQPRNSAALHYLGVIAGHAGNWAAGIKLVRDALKGEPKSAEAHADLGALLHGNRDLDGAATALMTALRLDPAHGAAHHNLGVVRRDQGRFAEAAASFGAAVGLRPDFVDAWYNLGVAWQGLGRYDDAVFAYRRATELDAHRVDIRTALGGLLFEMGDYPGAAASYRAALQTSPDLPDALNGLAAAEGQIGGEGAFEAIDRAIKAVPGNIYGYDVLGNVLRREGRFDEAVRAYETALRLPGNHAHTYYGLVRSRKLAPADQGIVAAMQEELERLGPGLSASDRSYFHFALGKALDDMDRCEEAIGHFDLANRAWLDARPPHQRVLSSEAMRQRDTAEFNALIAKIDAAQIARLHRWASGSERPVLIVGAMRSGTTLVEQILASHPDVAGGGERTFWNDWRLRVRVGLGGVPRQADAEQAVRDYEEDLRTVSADARRVTDKMPHNFLLTGVIHGLFPNARIIHCRRHPVDTALSIYFSRFARAQDFSYSRSDIVFFYKEYRRLMAHWRRLIPADRFIEVDYEAVVADPPAQTRRLLDFCGLGWDDACLSFHKTRRPIRTASSWQVRQPIYRSSVERWRRYEPWLGVFRELLDLPVP